MPDSGDTDSSDRTSRGQVSRRDVVTLAAGLGIGAGGTLLGYEVAGGGGGGDEGVSYDEESDVVVLGYGLAGASAAYGAAEAGASVTVIEPAAEGEAGADAALTDGLLYLGGELAANEDDDGEGMQGTELQNVMGELDTDERLLSYLELRYPDADQGRLESFANNLHAHYRWLRDDVELEIYKQAISTQRMDYFPGGGLTYSGAEFNYPFREEVEPIMRGHKIPGEGNTGPKLYDAIVEASSDEIDVRYETAVEEIVTDDAGAVEGVVTADANIEVADDVVLATGGWDMNEGMVQQHAPEFAALGEGGSSGLAQNDGSGILMAQDLGAKVEQMAQVSAEAFLWPEDPEEPMDTIHRQMPRAILLNEHGFRFVDESRPASDIGTAIIEEGGTAYMVIDGGIQEKVGTEYLSKFEKMFSANSFGQYNRLMNQRIGVSRDVANDVVGSYNSDAESGEDLSFGKPERYMATLYGSHHVYDVSADVLGLTYETHGGLAVDAEGQVLSRSDEPIEGLRATPGPANCITGPQADGGMEASTKTYFGKLAGEAAASGSGE